MLRLSSAAHWVLLVHGIRRELLADLDRAGPVSLQTEPHDRLRSADRGGARANHRGLFGPLRRPSNAAPFKASRSPDRPIADPSSTAPFPTPTSQVWAAGGPHRPALRVARARVTCCAGPRECALPASRLKPL